MSSRRQLLVQAAALAGAALTPAAWSSAIAQTRMADDPFGLGVASGEPSPDGMVLWTRLAPKLREPLGGMTPAPVTVRWEVATDPAMRQTVARGRALAVAEAGHSIHVEVRGLSPGREYWYRFNAAGHAHIAGRRRRH
jgi:alkaline phosphatase D